MYSGTLSQGQLPYKSDGEDIYPKVPEFYVVGDWPEFIFTP